MTVLLKTLEFSTRGQNSRVVIHVMPIFGVWIFIINAGVFPNDEFIASRHN